MILKFLYTLRLSEGRAMISAELDHNPYLLLTSVKFNGHKPRINSQIEKREHQPLQNWAHLVACIFYDEMNG